MSPKESSKRPLLNPVLSLLDKPRPFSPHGGGKSKEDIKSDRLKAQSRRLSSEVNAINRTCEESETHSGKLLLLVKMFDDSLSPSLTPDDIFKERASGATLISSIDEGYLVESSFRRLGDLGKQLANPRTDRQKVDVSRVESISHLPTKVRMNRAKLEELWSQSSEKMIGHRSIRSFAIWLLPYIDPQAKKSVARNFLTTLKGIHDWTVGPITDGAEDNDQKRWISSWRKKRSTQRLQDLLGNYEKGANPRIPVSLESKSKLAALVASGEIYRIDPVKRLHVTAPGSGPEPGSPPAPNVNGAPVVAVVDGGCNSRLYLAAEAWRAEKEFVPTSKANVKHGNQVTSLVVDAKGWNNNLDLPGFYCRYATAQVVPKETAIDFDYDEEELIEYLDQLMKKHPETTVWNFSLNQEGECHSDKISFLGHKLSRLARERRILPVISAGNKEPEDDLKISPPADCEAALVVSGRTHNQTGQVDGPCDQSRCGRGPQNLLKPDMSWFSDVRVIGGVRVTGTSYATPLVSRLAAHLWDNLRNPTPDLVRALLVNHCDLEDYDCKIGWGSPVFNKEPWHCPSGTAILAWTSHLQPGNEYAWDDIYIPTTMLKGGKLAGQISLTAILDPSVDSELIGTYFKSRIEVGLQYSGSDGKMENLLGSMRGGKQTRWNPIRVHCENFAYKRIPDGKLRLRARIYLRDRFDAERWQGEDGEPKFMEVTFVLMFKHKKGDPDTYDTLVKLMRNRVESATIEHMIEVEE